VLIGTARQMTPSPIQILFQKPSTMALFASNAPNHLTVKPSQGATCGKVLVLKAEAPIKSKGPKR